jgi:hypothetical protein
MHVPQSYSKHMGLCGSTIVARKEIDTWVTRTKLGQCAEAHLSFVTMDVWARVVSRQIYSSAYFLTYIKILDLHSLVFLQILSSSILKF